MEGHGRVVRVQLGGGGAVQVAFRICGESGRTPVGTEEVGLPGVVDGAGGSRGLHFHPANGVNLDVRGVGHGRARGCVAAWPLSSCSAVVKRGSMSTGTAVSLSSALCTCGRTTPSRSRSSFAFCVVALAPESS